MASEPIQNRLRVIAGRFGVSSAAELRCAADEIDRLLIENAELRGELKGIHQGIQWLKDEIGRLSARDVNGKLLATAAEMRRRNEIP